MNTNKRVIRMGYCFKFGTKIMDEGTDDEYLEPERVDICGPKRTLFPYTCLRPISHIDSDFVEENLPTIYHILNKMKEERKGHIIVPVSSVIDEINSMKSMTGEHEGRDRWFQDWANMCVQTYGDGAKLSVTLIKIDYERSLEFVGFFETSEKLVLAIYEKAYERYRNRDYKPVECAVLAEETLFEILQMKVLTPCAYYVTELAPFAKSVVEKTATVFPGSGFDFIDIEDIIEEIEEEFEDEFSTSCGWHY